VYPRPRANQSWESDGVIQYNARFAEGSVSVLMHKRPVLEVPHTRPFEVTGRGDHPAWQKVEPIPMLPRGGREVASHRTWFKALWSPGGVYFLIDCADTKIVATLGDNQPLWTEDVAEVFIWPHEPTPVYYEYNISPLGSEVGMMVPHVGHDYRPYLPFNWEGARLTHKAVSVRGGPLRGPALDRGVLHLLAGDAAAAQPPAGPRRLLAGEHFPDRLRQPAPPPLLRVARRGHELPQPHRVPHAAVRVTGRVTITIWLRR
jgi:hypothetical protein